MSYEVVCPGCGGSFHDISDKFNQDASSHTGDMFILKEQYGPNGYNWTAFPNNDGIQCGDLECPDCGTPYCSGGFKVNIRKIVVFNPVIIEDIPEIQDEVINLHTREQTPDDAWVCDRCGKLCKSNAGLIAHKRFCKK